jgi:hypothetical protein
MSATVSRELLFDELCLAAAEELEKAYLNEPFDQNVLTILADRLRDITLKKSIPAQAMTVEQTGLVWGIVREATNPGTKDYEEFKKGAESITALLEAPSRDRAKIKELFDLCLSLHDASISVTPIREVPLERNTIVTFA